MLRETFLTIAAAVTGGCAQFVSPPGPAIPDRPGYTDTPPVLPRSAVQLEAGYTDDQAGSLGYKTLGEMLLRLGVGGRTEVRLFANSFATLSGDGIESVNGMEDSKFGFKTNVRTKPDSIHSVGGQARRELDDAYSIIDLQQRCGGRSFRRHTVLRCRRTT